MGATRNFALLSRWRDVDGLNLDFCFARRFVRRYFCKELTDGNLFGGFKSSFLVGSISVSRIIVYKLSFLENIFKFVK